jgi:Holliday junction resolvase-like predicted endonuclease
LKGAGGLVADGELSTIARNDGVMGEALAKQFSEQLGVKVYVLQNASKHGVDLYAHDPTTNRYIVIEVKTSQHESYGAAPSMGPEAFFKDRAGKAAEGLGHWATHNVPNDLADRAIDIRTNLNSNTPSVVGYKYEISIPSDRGSGAPVLTIKRWGP